MKFLHLALTFCVLLFSGSVTFAQTAKTVERGSIINLLGEIDAVSYQWQVSSDGNHFIDLSNETNQNLTVKVNAPAFYRVKRSDKSATESFGEITHVLLSNVNYIGEPSVSSGAHGFVENGQGMPGSGISIPEDRDGAVATAVPTILLKLFIYIYALDSYEMFFARCILKKSFLCKFTWYQNVTI